MWKNRFSQTFYACLNYHKIRQTVCINHGVRGESVFWRLKREDEKIHLAVDEDKRAQTSRESQVDSGTYARPAAAKWRGQQSTCYRARRASRSVGPLRPLRRLGGEDSGRGKLRRRYAIRRTIGPNALDAEPIKRGEASSLLVDDVTQRGNDRGCRIVSHADTRNDPFTFLRARPDRILWLSHCPSRKKFQRYRWYAALHRDQELHGWAFNRVKTKKFQGNIKKLIV